MRSAKREDAESCDEISTTASLSSGSEDERESGEEREGGGPDGTQAEVEGYNERGASKTC